MTDAGLMQDYGLIQTLADVVCLGGSSYKILLHAICIDCFQSSLFRLSFQFALHSFNQFCELPILHTHYCDLSSNPGRSLFIYSNWFYNHLLFADIMKYETATYLIAFFGMAVAAPMPVAAPKTVFSIPRAMLRGREVPQEHSHDRFLDGVRVNLALNNPNNIQDPVFGLLGDAAAAAGAGSITNLECLHQATADQAFTNAKAAGNVTGQADALMYAALERNTGKVGLASVLCNETAVNPEIQAVQQHQDPASTGAAAGNKAVVLALAQQLASIGADPQEALLSGTFAPGNLDDDTGKGNTCDTVNDPDGGCIFSQNLLVDDATPAEISAAISSVASSASASLTTDAPSSDCSVTFVTASAASVAASTTSAAPAANTSV